MMSRFAHFLLIISLSVLLAACGSGGGVRTSVAKGASLPAPDSTSSSGVYQGATDYRIGAQDLLSITVFGVQDLTKDVRVNSNGQISLPLIGGVMAGGRTIPELESDLAGKYAAGYLQKPQVSVFVKEYTSQRVTFEGAITKPGIYPITGKTSLLQAIALAGGVDEKLADLGGIVLMRTIDGKRMAAAYDLRQIRKGAMEDPQVYGDDIIVVEQSASKTALRRFLDSVPVLGIFRFL